MVQRHHYLRQFPNVPFRSFPQSIWINATDRLSEEQAIEVGQQWAAPYIEHGDAQIAARDRESYEMCLRYWPNSPLQAIIAPDVAFMLGSRVDLRDKWVPRYNVLFFLRQDAESDFVVPDYILEEGVLALDLGLSRVKPITYIKQDWNRIDTKFVLEDGDHEDQKHYEDWAKTRTAFLFLTQAEFIVTDRLHGHILSTLLGIPHVLIDSRLGKSSSLYHTFTETCASSQLVHNWDETIEIIQAFFHR